MGRLYDQMIFAYVDKILWWCDHSNGILLGRTFAWFNLFLKILQKYFIWPLLEEKGLTKHLHEIRNIHCIVFQPHYSSLSFALAWMKWLPEMPLFLNIFSLLAAYKMYCNCVICCNFFTHRALRSSWELIEMCLSVPDRIRIWKCWFLRRGENWNTRRKTSCSKGENQQQTQPTYGVDAKIWTQATLVRGEWSHHCATLAPQVET